MTERSRVWHLGILGGAIVLCPLAIAGVADSLSKQVQWTAADYAVFALMLCALAFALFMAERFSCRRGRCLFALAAIASFLTIWALLAVGLDG